MEKARRDELIDLLEKLREKIRENTNPDGSCRFDAEHVKKMLLLTEDILDKSIDND